MQPVVIRFGNGRIRELGDEIRALGGKRGALITSPSFKKRGMVEKIMQDSSGLIVSAYCAVSPNPDIIEVQACIDLIHKDGCDFVVALGGGSVMDCAKAAACMCTANAPALDYLLGLKLPDTSLPLIAVPTTAGTGSEITSVSVLSDHARGLKKPLAGDALYPKLALVDPELTYSVPRHTTACTGMDVLCHAIEGYWSTQHQPICDALALHAVRLVLENLRTACDDPENAVAREKMAEASVIAGLAFALPKTTGSHACSYPLTSLLGIPHGEACALTIDRFMRMNAPGDDGRILFLAKALGYADIYALADAITALKQDIGVMQDLKSFNLSDELFDSIVEASKHPNLYKNPSPVSDEALRAMFEEMR